MNVSLTAVLPAMFSDGSDDELPPAVMSESEAGESMGLDDSVDLPAEIEEQSMDEGVGSEVDIELPSDVELDFDEVLKEEYDQRVPSPDDVASWLRSPTGISSKTSVGMELYSPPRVLASAGIRNLAIGILAFDIIHGWDLQKEDLQKITIQLLQLGIITFLYLSPPCTMFSELQRLWNRKKIDPAIWDARWAQAVGFLEHCMTAARLQSENKQRWMFEHPWKASSWGLDCVQSVRALPNVYTVDFDMCCVGMKSPKGTPVKKRTRIMTNCALLVKNLKGKQCPRDHEHRAVEGSELGKKMSTWCQIYPPELVSILADSMR